MLVGISEHLTKSGQPVFVERLTMRSIIFGFVILLVVHTSQQKFVIPDIAIQAIRPRGLVVSLPDSPGIQQFAFHGNVNNPIKGKEEGSISKEVGRATEGLWQIKDENVELKVGDVIYYWVFVQHNRLGFDRQEQKFTVGALVDSGTPPSVPTGPTETCSPSATTFNGGKAVCGGTLIYEDDFNTVNEEKWEKQYYIAGEPDLEFVTYEKQNIESANGFLNLRATLRHNVENVHSLDFTNGCTGNTCTRKIPGLLMPPIIAGQVKSRFKFRYGKIEIKAQLPKGDWVYPQLYLETRDPTNVYTNNGRIWLAYSRGNADLKTKSGEQIGNTVLYAGPVLSARDSDRYSAARVYNIQGGSKWSDALHTFTYTWRPDGMTVSVDGDSLGILNSATSYNKELQVTLGVAAGGLTDFPDECQSGPHVKPWKKTTYQTNRVFYENRNNWLPTWSDGTATLKIDSMKIWAL